ncbi:hypothetical protein K8B33_15745 [Alcanivorax sp. JB21]|uniref:hypothetical protein n=1 Tax=Alcanivorax limicola TaxID=2874102 RepID=UPI001CBED649|nr:hypothetical protein [Alcanivorax limicola]MBZ2190563.1 hypothetical protein [Alcanivorax limicola]
MSLYTGSLHAEPLHVPRGDTDQRNALTRSDGQQFFQRYQAALNAQAPERLAALIAEDAVLHIALVQPGDEAPQQFTLPRHRFLQHRRTLWHFASDVQQHFETPRYTAHADGTLEIGFTETERHKLFGQDAGQRNEVKLTLGQRDGAIVILTLHSNSHLW